MYKPVDSKVDFPKMEENILAFWQKNDIFAQSIKQRKNCPEFIFYDGPPFATGLPHFGHFVPGTIKDIIPRYKTMQGYMVERRFGWDCHGLPVEYEMEKELNISGKREIEEFGVAKFNEACRSIVLRYTKEWRTIITRLGRWVDFDNDYKTMDAGYMESIWWVVKQLWDKKLLYEGYYILPFCPRCSTALSNFELNLGGYRDVQDPAITVRFALKNQEYTYILAWTTTPWTLPSNLALALGADIDYVKVKDNNNYYILAKERLAAYYRNKDGYTIVERYKGKDLAGREYEPLFPFFSDLSKTGAFRIFNGDFVSTEDGTGIVHIAPGFGEDDYNILKNTGIPTVCPVDDEGRFTQEVTTYAAMYVKDADKQIIRDLKTQKKIVKHETYNHNYPHCWRCKSPLIYRAISSWFVDIKKIKQKMINANSRIYWMPGHLKEGRFGKWLEGARDWAISRNRYWGNPIPIWKCEKCKQAVCLDSRKQLEKLCGQQVTDLHKHFVDKLEFACQCGGMMKRIPEVLDCWFESGAMPYAQSHYPFENKEHFENNFPADFIAEGLDQTRGWFYTLTVLSAALFDQPAFENVVVNGLVLAKDGKKMSKSERNYTDPKEIVDEFGADSLRLFLMHSAAVKAEDLRYSNHGVKEVLKNIIIPMWNAYSFFITYANIDKITPQSAPTHPGNALDRWILSEAEHLLKAVQEEMEKYDLQKAIDPIVEFIDMLNNWYIRRSRRRFWRSENDQDKKEAYQTLYTVLMRLITVAAPFIPFITEEIYLNIKAANMPQSIHLCDFPQYNDKIRDHELENKMTITRKAVSMGRALRSALGLKIRQPLKALHIVTRNIKEKAILKEMAEIIKQELNVKQIVFRENEEELVEYTAKPNYRILGKIIGKQMKEAEQKIKALDSKQILSLLDGNNLNIAIAEKNYQLTQEHVIINRNEKENLKVLNQDSLTIALDSELNQALKQEGLVRDVVRAIQNLRKQKGLEVTDRIELFIHGSEQLKAPIKSFENYLAAETLTINWHWEKHDKSNQICCGDEECIIFINRC